MQNSLNYGFHSFYSYVSCSLEANWWVFGVRGIFSVLLGILSIIAGVGIYILLWSNPLLSLAILGYLIGFYALASGAALLLLSFKLLKLIKQHSLSNETKLTDMI
jgi:uncharacterized membrane protein HdeD (DUF308 family)